MNRGITNQKEKKKNPVFKMTILLHSKLSFVKIPPKKVASVFTASCSEILFPPRVDKREKPSAVQTQIPTVKSGSHQT